MKSGDKINIYQDPIEKKELEGIARLVRKVKHKGLLEVWHIIFVDAPDLGQQRRLIKTGSSILALFFATTHMISYQTLEILKLMT